MIRNNKQMHAKQEAACLSKIHTYNYRNAIYQGQMNGHNGKRQGKGIIYISDNHHFIVCNNFVNNFLNDYTYIMHHHARYTYGMWQQNQPNGPTIFRMNQVVVLLEYQQGCLPIGSKVLLMFQRYNTGLIVEVIKDDLWILVEKAEVLCTQHLQGLIQQCQFKEPVLPSLLIRYLNNYLLSDLSKPFIKLRLLNDTYYRLGFDQGLAVIFDDSYKILSVGVHAKTHLTSFGVKYFKENLNSKVEEGIFDGYNTYVFDQHQKPVHKIGQLYCQQHLKEVNFKNQIYKDPSQQLFEYLQRLLESQLVTSIFADLILHNAKDESNHQILIQSSSESLKESKPKVYQKLDFPETQLHTFKRQQSRATHKDPQQSVSMEEAGQVVWENSHKGVQTIEFQKLSEKNRLQILKKELTINVNHKQSRHREDEEKKSRIIMMPKVDLRNVQNSRFRTPKSHLLKRQDLEVYDLPRNEPQSNLDKHINIRINDFPERPLSQKKIFEQFPNIIKDYSPARSSWSPSPFKSKMKSRIFSKTPERHSKSRSKSTKRIFTNTKTPEKLQIQKFNLSKVPESLLSPHRLLDVSVQKSDSSSHIKAYPITLGSRLNQKKVQPMQQKQEENIKVVDSDPNYKEQKVSVQEYIAKKEQSSSFSNKALREEASKRNNLVYKNHMKSEYGDYLFQPISINQTGNMPYRTLSKDTSKKAISESIPFNRGKMSHYMNNTYQDIRGPEHLGEFKRKVNYF